MSAQPENIHPSSIRRRLRDGTGGRRRFEVESKDKLHLLFVVSRPKRRRLCRSRADSGAVIDAIGHQAPGRVTWEFLRSPTLEALRNRLDDDMPTCAKTTMPPWPR